MQINVSHCGQIKTTNKTNRDKYNFKHNCNPSLQEIIGAKSPFKDEEKYFDSHEEAIEDHVERRAQLFFAELIACYKMPLEFSSHEALDQGGSASKVKVEGKSRHRNAAHSATLPCLVAKVKNTAQEFFYLKGTYFYNCQNETKALPIEVNQVDIAVDANLRKSALKLIQESSKGEDPALLFKKFIVELRESVKEVGNKKEKSAYYVKVLEVYQKVSRSLKKEVNSKKWSPDQWLGVFTEQKLSKKNLKHCYEMIRDNYLLESKIHSEIEAFVQKVSLAKISVFDLSREIERRLTLDGQAKEAFKRLFIQRHEERSHRTAEIALGKFEKDFAVLKAKLTDLVKSAIAKKQKNPPLPFIPQFFYNEVT